jgi:hypothetical protein
MRMSVLAAETDLSDARFLPMSAIGTKQRAQCADECSAFGGKADIDQPLLSNLDL